MVTILKTANRLKTGDLILSSTGRALVVTSVKETANRIIVLLEGDLEIDFNPYSRIPIVEPKKSIPILVP